MNLRRITVWMLILTIVLSALVISVALPLTLGASDADHAGVLMAGPTCPNGSGADGG